jgi:hypothetical protein
MTERLLSSALKHRTRGAIYVEVLFSIIPVLMFFFGLLQLAMFHSARLIVRHAAWRAVRSAVVVLEDDPEHYDGEERRKVYDAPATGESDGGGGIAESLGSVLGLHLPTAGLGGGSSNQGGARLSAIRRAAYMSLAVLAPPTSVLMQSLGMSGDEFGNTGNGVRFLSGLFLYNKAAAMVTLRLPDGAIANDVPSDGNVTVRVSYLYYCGMPIVNYFMCDSVLDMSGLGKVQGIATDFYRSVTNDPLGARQAASNFQSDLRKAGDTAEAVSRDLAYAESPELLLPLMFSRARFKILTAEATLPNQGACYYEGSSCYAADLPQ